MCSNGFSHVLGNQIGVRRRRGAPSSPMGNYVTNQAGEFRDR